MKQISSPNLAATKLLDPSLYANDIMGEMRKRSCTLSTISKPRASSPDLRSPDIIPEHFPHHMTFSRFDIKSSQSLINKQPEYYQIMDHSYETIKNNSPAIFTLKRTSPILSSKVSRKSLRKGYRVSSRRPLAPNPTQIGQPPDQSLR